MTKKKKIISIVAIVVLAIIALIAAAASRPTPVEFSSTAVERIDLLQTVAETGSVVANVDLSYGWETSGRVAEVYKVVGDEVKKGDKIAQLENARQAANVQEARAALAAAQARLNVEITDPSEYDEQQSFASLEQAKAKQVQAEAELLRTKSVASDRIADAEDDVRQAELDLQLAEGGNNSEIVKDAYADLVNDIKSSMTALENALIQSDTILGIDNTLSNDSFDDGVGLLSESALDKAEFSYLLAKEANQAVASKANMLTTNSSQSDIDAATSLMKTALTTMQSHLSDVQQVILYSRPVGNMTQTELEGLQTDINTEKKSVDANATSLTNAEQAVRTAKNSLTTYEITYDAARRALDTTKQQAEADVAIAEAAVQNAKATVIQYQAAYDTLVSPPREVDVAALRADVTRQQAIVSQYADEYNKTVLTALADGVVTRIDVDPGETVSANQEAITLESKELNVEVDVSESDVAKVTLGDSVEITLDAFGDERVFVGKVVQVEPAETEISGVIYYKTRIIFEEEDMIGIRPGMTANVRIQTDKKDQVLVVPRRALIQKDGVYLVRILKDEELGTYEEREVQLGLRGDDGLVEVIGSISTDDQIITFIKE